jgi:BirA family biotin operon repressor/biotin-[acetyl-CoA-carboxylase] ligase
MEYTITHLRTTDSTNSYLAHHGGEGCHVVWTDFQTAGRGSGHNRWESEDGSNLLFSMLIHPHSLLPASQFRVSMAISLAIVRTLKPLLQEFECSGCRGLSIKWPNDIYWNDSKLAGILIENRLGSRQIIQSIIGVGLNVNQTQFLSEAPNPISLRTITGRCHDREHLLHSIVRAFTLDFDAFDYRSLLYRRNGFFTYSDANGTFEAEMETVEDDGHLILRDRQGRLRSYAFKEVQYDL